jgi:MurNAc alpha-1-phosphate uridylyltransferase
MLGNDGSPRYTFSGISHYHRDFFAGLKPARQALAPLLRTAISEQRVTGELYHGNWTDIGTLERLQSLNH